ncbi:hypothetical protein MNBD_GAMMA16-855 [hydrothermal vent metagenome]|uniref:Lipoprotein n=1 Tax=hydrothermal vent metagenome TaxID=652676 RepID=A0A3B0ZKL9_9ZZZZ
MKNQKNKQHFLSGTLLVSLFTFTLGCGFDPTAEKHDDTRYKELQKSDCDQMASLGSSTLVREEPEDHSVVYIQCLKMKALSFAEYQAAAHKARDTGEWDFDSMPMPTNLPKKIETSD